MPRSTASSESLSSPSPTPPPRSRTTSANTNTKHTSAARAAGLESGSELSDLTEDEDGEDGGNGGRKPSSEGPSRQRRGGLVPPPMWDWAYKAREEEALNALLPPSDDSDDDDEEGDHEGEDVEIEEDAPEPVKTEEIGEDEEDAAEDEEEEPPEDPDEDSTLPPPIQAKSESPAPVSASEAPDELLPQRGQTEGEDAEGDLQEELLAKAEAEIDEPEGEADADVTDAGVAEPTETPPDADGEEDIEVEVEAEAYAEPEPVPAEEGEEDEADDAMEADTDLQPPQRAEALDILAGIEVKFAILRERIYIDKMEEIAQEEAMVRNDIHPELLHFMATLSQRRERRISLASLRRKYDEDFIHKKRKADEDAVWSWWRVRKDDLRDCMVAETNGKRRRLEREKRSLESRTGVRHPTTPGEVHLPPPQTIRQIMRQHQRPTSSAKFPMHASLPSLPTLTESEITQDLDILINARRQKYPYNHTSSYHPHSHNHIPHHAHNQDIYSSTSTGVGGEYGIIDGSQYAGMPPPTIQNPPSSSQHRLHVSHSAPLAGSRSYPSTSGMHLHDGPSNYSLPPTTSSTTQSSRNYASAYPPTSGSHMHEGPSNYALPSPVSSSSQQPRNYSSASQYVQQLPPNQMHITTAPVIPRKRSLSPNRANLSHGGSQANVWEDGNYRRSKIPRVGNADGVDAMDEWGGPLSQPPLRRGQPPSQRHIHRPTSEQYPPYDDGIGSRERPQSNASGRVPVSVE